MKLIFKDKGLFGGSGPGVLPLRGTGREHNKRNCKVTKIKGGGVSVTHPLFHIYIIRRMTLLGRRRRRGGSYHSTIFPSIIIILRLIKIYFSVHFFVTSC